MKKCFNHFIKKIHDTYAFTYIDVGAMGSLPLKWEYLLDAMQVIAFEPDPRGYSKLKSNKLMRIERVTIIT